MSCFVMVRRASQPRRCPSVSRMPFLHPVSLHSVPAAAPNIADGGVDTAAPNAANIADGGVDAAAGPSVRRTLFRAYRARAGAR